MNYIAIKHSQWSKKKCKKQSNAVTFRRTRNDYLRLCVVIHMIYLPTNGKAKNIPIIISVLEQDIV